MTREEAIAILQEEIDGNLELSLREWQERDEQKLFPAFRMAIEALQAEPKIGEWIRWVVEIENETGVSYIPHAKCSNCGNEQESYTTQFINFCPNCGAYMAKENEE